MKDEGMMKRIIIATVISFVFFMAYDYFVIQPQTKAANEVAQHQKNANTNTTKTNNQIENSNNKISKTEVKKAKIIAIVKSSAFEVHIDELGRISQYILEKNIFNDEKGHKLQLLGNKLPKPMEIRFKNEELNKESFHTPVTIDKNDVVLNGKQQTVTITQKLKELTVQKIITFYPDGHYDLNVKLSKDEPYFLAVGYEPQGAVNMYAFHGAILENPDGTLEKISDGDAEDKTFKNIKIAAMVDQYYTTFMYNWGVAIILFVVLVRLILFPLTYRGMVSMYKLKEMAPKMKELKEKYGKDPQKFQMKTMEMYKKEGANPLGGCLPMLIQIPIFFAIYRVLINAIELKGANFLWIHDLSAMDPYFILPVLMGLTMYLHQRVTPNNFTDPMQEKIFKFLPLIFTFFFFSFAAGLVLYWTINNILSFLQQLVINKKMQAIEKAKKEAKK
jgi:YidC/Oxa1 family membrane protein insertase